MVNTQLKKMSIIELILQISDDKHLDVIEQQAKSLVQKASKQPNPFEAVKPVRKNVSLEQIMAEQAYQPINYASFKSLAKAIALEDPIEELLADLNA